MNKEHTATSMPTIKDMESEFLKHYQNLLKNPRFDRDMLQDTFIKVYPYLLKCICEGRQINIFACFKVIYRQTCTIHHQQNKRFVWCDQSSAFDQGSSHTPGYADGARNRRDFKDNFNNIF